MKRMDDKSMKGRKSEDPGYNMTPEKRVKSRQSRRDGRQEAGQQVRRGKLR